MLWCSCNKSNTLKFKKPLYKMSIIKLRDEQLKKKFEQKEKFEKERDEQLNEKATNNSTGLTVNSSSEVAIRLCIEPSTAKTDNADFFCWQNEFLKENFVFVLKVPIKTIASLYKKM